MFGFTATNIEKHRKILLSYNAAALKKFKFHFFAAKLFFWHAPANDCY